jgi:olefin beta-lactone synthetase
VNLRRSLPAELPPGGLSGLDPAWSRLVTAIGSDGTERTWHVLDSGPRTPTAGTLLCVHGNPTWSYLWRSVLAAAPAGWRVVAPDHLGMGFSERPGGTCAQRLADRVFDLGALTHALDISGPVVTVAHDWGGAISLGWALAHRAQLSGIVLTNTAIGRPGGAPAPALIRIARDRRVLGVGSQRTTAFLDGTLLLAHPALPARVRAAYRSPYLLAERRAAIADFVADIPLDESDPSMPALRGIADGVSSLAEVPTLVLWGPRDPVFSDRYLDDLSARFPQADVHRFPRAGHLLTEDADVAGAIAAWLPPRARALKRPDVRPEAGSSRTGDRRPLWSALADRAGDATPAIVQAARSGTRTRPESARATVGFDLLSRRSRALAAGLASHGVRRGERVAVLVPPGADLIATVYACWMCGAVPVLADAGLGTRGLFGALASARPAYLMGIPRAVVAARALGLLHGCEPILAGSAAGPRSAFARRLGVRESVGTLARLGWGLPLPEPPGADDEAAVLFTSGATGPPKGVLYRHGQLEAQRDALAAAYAIGPADRLVAAFAPFAIYGPALGIPVAIPDVDVTEPGRLRASALAEAVDAVSGTVVFASPAALANVVATAHDLDESDRDSLSQVRLVLSAGAPVPVSLMRAVGDLFGKAEPHSPYGMTEVLPVTDISLTEVLQTPPGDGVCVGRPIDGVQVAVSALAADGRAQAGLSRTTDVVGEICVRAAHAKDRYDRLWATERASVASPGWHRTGDVGHVDGSGRLWVEGRLAHVITTADGVVTPVPIEQRVERLDPVVMAAAVGVGPVGAQVIVVVVVPRAAMPATGGPVADARLAAAVREAAGPNDVAAVLITPSLPVDIRHNSKIDRVRVAGWAAGVLRGERAGRLGRKARRP